MKYIKVQPYEGICPTCGKTFFGNKSKIYCSDKCKPSTSRGKGIYKSKVKRVGESSKIRTCPTCNVAFTANVRKKYCSSKCYPSYANGPRLNLPTPTTGALAELAVCSDLMLHGFSVFRAQSPACYCDLIAKKNGVILEVEVRTGNTYNGRLRFPKHYHKDANCFAIWDKSTYLITYLTTHTLEPILLVYDDKE